MRFCRPRFLKLDSLFSATKLPLHPARDKAPAKHAHVASCFTCTPPKSLSPALYQHQYGVKHDLEVECEAHVFDVEDIEF